MRHVVVRYRVKPERLVEHEALVAAVFAQLAEKAPEGLRYEVLRLSDGLSFVHVATHPKAHNPLASLEAFKAFTADIKSRVEEPPLSTEGTRLGSYGPGSSL